MGKRGKKKPWRMLSTPKVEDANFAPDNQNTGLDQLENNLASTEDAPTHTGYASADEPDFPSLRNDNPGEQLHESSFPAQVNAGPCLSADQFNFVWNSHSLDFSDSNDRAWQNKPTKNNERLGNALGAQKKDVNRTTKKSRKQLLAATEVEKDTDMVKTNTSAAVGLTTDECLPPKACRDCLWRQLVVRVDDCIVTWTNPRCIWTYNLWTEGWMMYEMPQEQELPDPDETQFLNYHYSAVAIESDVYVFGRGITTLSMKSFMWKLTRCLDGSFEWSVIHDDNFEGDLPSPRIWHSAWEHGKKMWVFGGVNDSLEPLEIDNELLCFDPSIPAWSSPTCSGDIPPTLKKASSAKIDNTVWLYAGMTDFNGAGPHPFHDDIYELNMNSFVWTLVETDGSRPLGLCAASLTPTASRQLVYHGGRMGLVGRGEDKSWIFDVDSHTWREHTEEHGYNRHHHSGITDLDGNVLIIGGEAKYDRRVRRTDKYPVSHQFLFLVTLHPKPKTLVQVAVKMIYKHRTDLLWKVLPPTLIHKLMGTNNFDDSMKCFKLY